MDVSSFFFSSRRRHTRFTSDWSSDVCSSDLIDSKTLLKAAKETGKVVTVEDHWPQGGLGEAVLEVLSQEKTSTLVTKLAVSSMPTSGSPEDLLSAAGIDSQHITEAVKNLIASS